MLPEIGETRWKTVVATRLDQVKDLLVIITVDIATTGYRFTKKRIFPYDQSAFHTYSIFEGQASSQLGYDRNRSGYGLH